MTDSLKVMRPKELQSAAGLVLLTVLKLPQKASTFVESGSKITWQNWDLSGFQLWASVRAAKFISVRANSQTVA
jgi:hypothetical protein